MGYVYALMWMIIGAFIFVKSRKINPIFYVISLYFEFMGLCWLINEVSNINVFEGIYLIAFRVISAIVLIIVSVIYFREKRKVS